VSLLKPAYMLPISTAKKADLVKRCNDGAIPSKFHTFTQCTQKCQHSSRLLTKPDCIEAIENILCSMAKMITTSQSI